MRIVGDCATFPIREVRCDACGRPIRCVYVVDDGGWHFLFGRRCYQRLQAFLHEPVR